MPYYEVTLTVEKPVLVEAPDEEAAEQAAVDEWGLEWNRAEACAEGALSEEDDAEIIAEYKLHGEFVRDIEEDES